MTPSAYESLTLVEQFRLHRRVSTPLIQIDTADPAAVVQSLLDTYADADPQPPIFSYDLIRGLAALNDAAAEVGGLDPDDCADPIGLLRQLGATRDGTADDVLPERSIVFVHQAHLLIQPSREAKGLEAIQGIWNLRDPFKTNRRTLVLLTPGVTLPIELANDVAVLVDPLPDDAALRDLVGRVMTSASMTLDETAVEQCVDAMAGLAEFPAEQALALSTDTQAARVDIASLWTRKKQQIDRTPGLSIWHSDTTLDDVGGYQNVKTFLRRYIDTQDTQVVVWIDEIEKALFGAENEGNGIIMDQVSQLLTFMEDRAVPALLFLGFPGAGKSAIAKSTGKLTVQLDLGGMLGSLVGESQNHIRTALATIEAVSRGKLLFVATCNGVSSLRTELLRRFSLGKFFFDLPTAAERDAIWRLYRERYPALAAHALPADEGWSGANIRECITKAARLNLDLESAARYVVPEARASARVLDSLREEADGVWISASQEGCYTRPRTTRARVARPRVMRGES